MTDLPLLPLFAAAVLIALIAGIVASKRSGASSYRQTALFNSTEQRVFLELISRAPANAYILAKVRLADLVEATGSTKERRIGFNKVSRKHLDIVVYDAKTRKVICAVEIDGPSHNSAKQTHADKTKNDALASAGIRLVRLSASNWMNPKTFSEIFNNERDEQVSEQLQATSRPPVGLRTSKAAGYQPPANEQLPPRSQQR